MKNAPKVFHFFGDHTGKKNKQPKSKKTTNPEEIKGKGNTVKR